MWQEVSASHVGIVSSLANSLEIQRAPLASGPDVARGTSSAKGRSTCHLPGKAKGSSPVSSRARSRSPNAVPAPESRLETIGGRLQGATPKPPVATSHSDSHRPPASLDSQPIEINRGFTHEAFLGSFSSGFRQVLRCLPSLHTPSFRSHVGVKSATPE